MSEVEINRINANTIRIIAEANKLFAERMRFSVEPAKLDRDRQWYPVVLGGTIGGALLAAGAALAKLFLTP